MINTVHNKKPSVFKVTVDVVLQFQGELHKIRRSSEYTKSDLHWAYQAFLDWTEGDYGCDCNRYNLITPNSEKEMECGELIKLIEFKAIAYENGDLKTYQYLCDGKYKNPYV